MDGKIRAEWDSLKKVVIHRPGIEMFFGLLDPSGSLYERAFSKEGARFEHEMLENVLRKEFKIEVYRLKETILNAADKDINIRNRLVEMALETIENDGDPKTNERIRKEFEHNAKYLDSAHFFNVLLLNPGIEMNVASGFQDVSLSITRRFPLSNLYFMRDQQFVTDKGLILSRMARPARRNEPKITKFLWEKILQIPILYEIQPPGEIEGGEFLPMGNFALIGIGSRTNRSAIDQILSLNFDYQEIGVVHQPMHPLVPSDTPDPMINMHLDTYFNVASRDVVVGSELLLKAAEVEVYQNEGTKFVRDPKKINLYDYLISKKFHIVSITTLEQMAYATNFLCIRDGKILAIEVERIVRDVLSNLEAKAKENPVRFGKLYAQAKADMEYLKNEGQFFPHKKEMYRLGIDSYPVILKNLTGGYGGAHCMTCALTRE